MSAPLLSANDRVEAVEHGAIWLHGFEKETPAVNANQHRVVGGPGAGRQSILARRVEPPAASPAHHVGRSLYGHGAFIDVVVTREDEIDPVPREERLEVSSDRLVAAVPRRAVRGPVQEHHLPALARGGQIALQKGLLPLGTGTLVAVVQFAIQGDEVGISPVEGVVAFRAARAVEGRVEILEKGGAIPLSHVVVAEDRKDGHILDEVFIWREEASIVVAFLAARVYHVARVQDEIRPQAFQKSCHCVLPLTPATAVADHGEGKAGVLAIGGGTEAARRRCPADTLHPVVVDRAWFQTRDRDGVASTDPTIDLRPFEPRRLSVFHHPRAGSCAPPGDHGRGRRDALHVRPARGPLRCYETVEQGAPGRDGRTQPPGPKHRPQPLPYRVVISHPTRCYPRGERNPRSDNSATFGLQELSLLAHPSESPGGGATARRGLAASSPL